MKRIGILALLLAVLAPTSYEADTHNGVAWQALSRVPQLKEMYVSGVMAGVMLEMEIADAGKDAAMPSCQHAFFKAQIAALTRSDGKPPAPSEIAHAVDAFYDKTQNLPVCSNHAVEIEWLSLAGAPFNDVELSNFREQDGKNGCF